ncbi:MAG: histidine kinase [Ignavibacteriales bacterium]|nr:histidine kinase [Ignavibacteriales bacterium]
MNNPLLKLKNFIYYLIFWTTVSIVQFILLAEALAFPWGYAALDSLISNVSFMLLGVSLWYMVKYINIQENTFIKVLLQNSVGIILSALIAVGITDFIFRNILLSDDQTMKFLYSTFYWRLLLGVLYFTLIVSINYLIIFYYNLRDKIEREVELNTLVKEAELRTLKYQLNPHFIFNSLNSISSLTITNPDRAREMIIKLSGFLRSTLSENEKQTNELGEELKNIKLYLDIEKIRFGDKFELIEDYTPECLKVKVPNMIFQPLFENAIKYGVYESLEKIFIKVKCSRENNYLKFTVENNFDEEIRIKKGKGIGLQNIKNRLSLIYNQDNLLSVEKKKDLFTVNVFIPIA